MQTDIIRVFIGYDPREDAAYKVTKHSIEARSSLPVMITPLRLAPLGRSGLYRRPHSVVTRTDGTKQRYDDLDGKPFSTDFSFTRFLVPSLQQWDGWAIFVDCDFLFKTDIAKLWEMRDRTLAVQVVQHRQSVTYEEKMDRQIQQEYPRKNWSSLIMWNCAHPMNKRLTPDVVNGQSGTWLHGFRWLRDDEIGALPESWNWLEGHSAKEIVPDAVHYTRGGPWFADYANCAYAQDWIDEARAAGL